MNTYYLSSTDLLEGFDSDRTSRRPPSSHCHSHDHDGCNKNDEDIHYSKNSLSTFLHAYLDNKLTPHVKSEKRIKSDENANTSDEDGAQEVKVGVSPPSPFATLSSGVQILSASNFPLLFKEPELSKHALVYFYAPTCGHCKRFDPMYHKLSRLVTKLGWNPKLSVMKVDISMNEIHHDGIDVRSVPSVYFFPAGTRKNDPQLLTLGGDADGFDNVGGISDPMVIIRWILDMLSSEDLIELRSLARSVDR
jgi:thiol-disulfide isomerase/thioredoxin